MADYISFRPLQGIIRPAVLDMVVSIREWIDRPLFVSEAKGAALRDGQCVSKLFLHSLWKSVL